MNQFQKKALMLGSIGLFLAVMLGAFGAHGLKSITTDDKIATYLTGVRYHYYHSFGLLFLGIISKVFDIKLNMSLMFFVVGIILFSFNCYLYTLTDIKVFAMIVPLGGVSFLIGWAILVANIFKTKALN